jgi:hypothetical protein
VLVATELHSSGLVGDFLVYLRLRPHSNSRNPRKCLECSSTAESTKHKNAFYPTPFSYGTLALHKTHLQSNFTHIYPRRMAFLKQCIRGSPTSPTLIENDDVYPVHTLDDTKTLRRLLLAWTICFNDALDAHKLRCALAKLLDIGDWRKIGGRLALKVILHPYATE